MRPSPREPIRQPNTILLSIARLGVGTLFLIRTTGLATLMHLQVTPRATFLLGWPAIGDPGFGAPFLLPGPIVAAACGFRTVAAVFFTLGLFTRPAGIAAALLAYLVASQDPIGFNMTMHVLFLGMLVLAATDAGSRLAVRSGRTESVASSFGLVRIWVASIYAWAGLAKLNPDWLSGRVLQSLLRNGVVHGPIATAALASAARASLVAPALALAEMGIGVLLIIRKTRRFALVAAYAAHVGFQVTLAPDLLGWAMAFLLLTFIGDLGPWRTVFAPAVAPQVSATNTGGDLRGA